MRRSSPSAAIAIALTALIAATGVATSLLSAAGGAASARPAATDESQVVVTIPGNSSPSPSASGPGGSGGGGPGGDLPTLTPPAPTPPAVPREPTEDADALRLDPDRIEAGQLIIATGTGFTPGESVQFVVYSDPVVVGSFTAEFDGTVVARIEDTDDLRLGVHTVEATGWDSGRVANATFTLVSPAGSGISWFPWIVWIIAGSVIVLAIIVYGVGAARGWLPAPAWPARRPVA